MDLRVLRYFLAVAEEGNITRAAEKLFLTQPTLSKQLMQLEDELGAPLLIRGTRRVELTDAGRILRRRAAELLAMAERTREEVVRRDELSGEVAIGAGETAAFRLLAEGAATLRQKHPGIRFRLYSGNAEDVIERLECGVLDFGVLIEPTDLSAFDFIGLPARDRWGMLLRKDHPLARKTAIAPADLDGVPLLCSSQKRVTEFLSHWLGKPFAGLNIIGTYNLIYNAAQFVISGNGCAITLDRLADVSADSPLTFRPLSPSLEVGLALVHSRRRPLSQPARAFLKIIEALPPCF